MNPSAASRLAVLAALLSVPLGCVEPRMGLPPDAATADVTPTPDVPGVDIPAVDVPAVDIPAVDVSSVDAPAVDTPSVDVPVVDTPATDTGFDAGFDAGFDVGFDSGTPDVGTPDVGTPDVGTPDVGCTGPGRVMCGSTCTNVQTDDNNCGLCLTRCTDQLHCSRGMCVETQVKGIALGVRHTCAALGGANVVRCWGDNASGQLGDGTNTSSATPVAVGGGVMGVDVVSDVPRMSLGDRHTCVVRLGGTVQCWGANDAGQLGTGTMAASFSPVTVTGLTGAVYVSAGFAHTCAWRADLEHLSCWGANDHGQLGDGTTNSRSTPNTINTVFQTLGMASGSSHDCLLLADHTMRCWGHNGFGQLGDATTADRSSPVTVLSLNGITRLGASDAPVSTTTGPTGGHTCARDMNSVVRCWGDNQFGQLGDQSTNPRLVPTEIRPEQDFADVAVGGFHTCARAGTAVYCWGRNDAGQLGDGTTTNRSQPTAVVGLPPIRAIAAGLRHTCAVSTTSQAWCWGDNTYGQLGDGTHAARSTPVLVVF